MFMSHYATEVCKCPSKSLTFTLNVGNYIVDCTGASVVGGNGENSTAIQIHEGEETNLYFSGK